ncbi:MAG: hypothetical protein ACLQDV_17025 [Candidatus Binataceae bacterium]
MRTESEDFALLGGKAHLRIENRVLPSGPTVLDEISNAAFFIGLMSAGPAALPDLSKRMAFSDAEANFLAAAQVGLEARFTWLDGKCWTARDLIGQELLPMARDGLRKAGIVAADIDRYLGVLARRVESGRTGSQWLLHSLAGMQGSDTKDAIAGALAAATVQRQWEGKPVHDVSARPEAFRGENLDRRDSLADDAVSCELLSESNSLINRENTGNFFVLSLYPTC